MWSARHGGDLRASAQPPTVPRPRDGVNTALCLLLPQVCQPRALLPAPSLAYTLLLRRCLGWRGPGRAPCTSPGPGARRTKWRTGWPDCRPWRWRRARQRCRATHLAPTHPLRRGSEKVVCLPAQAFLPTLCGALRPGQQSVLTPHGWGRARVAWQAPHKPVKKIPAPFRGQRSTAEPGTEGRGAACLPGNDDHFHVGLPAAERYH